MFSSNSRGYFNKPLNQYKACLYTFEGIFYAESKKNE